MGAFFKVNTIQYTYSLFTCTLINGEEDLIKFWSILELNQLLEALKNASANDPFS